MRYKKIGFILIIAILGCMAYYWLEYQKLARVEKTVQAWQTSHANSLVFTYHTISARLLSEDIVLENVKVTYPVLLTIDKLNLNLAKKAGNLLSLEFHGEGLNFTWPSLTGNQVWEGNLDINYQYQAEERMVTMAYLVDFPQLILAKGELVFNEITPSVDLLFNYPEVLLSQMQLYLHNRGLIESLLPELGGDEVLLQWMNALANQNQSVALAQFWSKHMPLIVTFQPEQPVPVYRLLHNQRLLWQHPNIVMTQ